MKILLSCEHATNKVPEEYQHLFNTDRGKRALASNKSFNPGSEDLFDYLQKNLKVDFAEKTKVTYLLVDVNKSLSHIRLHSVFTDKLTPQERSKLVDTYYTPYRDAISRFIEKQTGKGEMVVHLSISSFEHIHRGVERDGDIGILYDTHQIEEREFAAPIKVFLSKRGNKARTNYPIQGRADSLTTQLRKTFDSNYLGIDLSVNQKLAVTGGAAWDKLKADLVDVLKIAFKLQEESLSNNKLY
ncbi:MAG: N-formylglutamate amidohydrolase [Luteibaculaceae bacterium]